MKCQICGRKLKSVRSIVRGMGCTCARRDKEQLKLEIEKVGENGGNKSNTKADKNTSR